MESSSGGCGSSRQGHPSGLSCQEFANRAIPSGLFLTVGFAGDFGILHPGPSFGTAPLGVRQQGLSFGIVPHGGLRWKCSGRSDRSFPSGLLHQEFANGRPSGDSLRSAPATRRVRDSSAEAFLLGLSLQEFSFELLLRENLAWSMSTGVASTELSYGSFGLSRGVAPTGASFGKLLTEYLQRAIRGSRGEQTRPASREVFPREPFAPGMTAQSSPSGGVCDRAVRRSHARAVMYRVARTRGAPAPSDG
jgi:hypothetical protein